uniref:Uncharacterized protein n=1 Tax=Arcella intermedia TaxID=1963864 RepID=A0A6B2L1C0_9EUKA
MSQLTFLNVLKFQNNQINGILDDTMIQSLINLQYMDLSHNLLSGTIPPTITSLQNINYLNFSFNQFTGEVPNVQNMTFVFLDLSSNQLYGTLPNILQSYSNLSVLSYQPYNTPSVINDLTSYFNQHTTPGEIEVALSLKCGVILFDCDCSHPSTCLITCPSQNIELESCFYPCSKTSICSYLQLDNLFGFSPIYLDDQQQYVNVSNSQLQMVGNVTLNTIFSFDSSIIVTGAFRLSNGTQFLEDSNIIITESITFYGSTIYFGKNSTILCYGAVQIINSTFVVDFTNHPNHRELILFTSTFNIDLSTTNFQVTNGDNQNCYHLLTQESKLLVLRACEANKIVNVSGYSPIYISEFEKYFNISNSQVQIIGSISLNSLSLFYSSAIVNGSFSMYNGTISLLHSDILVKKNISFDGTTITFDEDSIITCEGPIQIKNTILKVNFDPKYQSRDLIYFHSSSNIDLTSVSLEVTSNQQNCYHLEQGKFSLLVSSGCGQSPISPGVIGGIVGGVVALVIVIGVIIFIWAKDNEKKMLSLLSVSQEKPTQ